MTQFPEAVNPNTEQPREISFEELDLTLAKPGDLITGLDSNDTFNALEDKISEQVFGYRTPRSWDPYTSSHYRNLKSMVGQGPLARALRPKGKQAQFVGQLQNGTALILPGLHCKGMWAEINLLITADMSSTGRGWIGSFARTVEYGKPRNSSIPRRKLGKFTNANQAIAFVESLGWEANTVSRVVGALALQKGEVSAGLPTLGKDSN